MQKEIRNAIEDLTEHDWIQIEQAARGCVSGTSVEWPHLMRAIQKISGPQPFRTAEWLRGYCLACWKLVGLSAMYRIQLKNTGFTSWKKANRRRLELIHVTDRTPEQEQQLQGLQILAEYYLELAQSPCL